jgi:alkylation response protein AidB-like acyl-CoA dehydrogenase
MTTAKTQAEKMALRALPGDEVRQIVWRFADRYDLQMAVQAVRALARGPVARMVADGARNSHEWTDEKAELLNAFDASGLTALGMDPEFGGYIEGPKNLAPISPSVRSTSVAHQSNRRPT